MDKKEEYGAYLFAHFTGGTGETEKLYYGVSRDGYHFKALNEGKPVFTSFLGTGHLRDPYVFSGEDGYYYIAVTDMCSREGWASQSTIAIYKTADLIHVEEGILIDYRDFIGFEDCNRAWAPHILWCEEKNAYMIYLSLQNASTENMLGTVMYRHYAKDLMELSTYTVPELMLCGEEAGKGAIDGDIIYDAFEKRYLMYYGGKYISEAESLSGMFQKTGEFVPFKTDTGDDMGVEGSHIYKLTGENKWIIAADGTPFNGGKYAMAETVDFKNYRQLDEKKGEYSFHLIPRHGFVIPITAQQLHKLIDQYGIVELEDKH